jgi:hypothetical protein
MMIVYGVASRRDYRDVRSRREIVGASARGLWEVSLEMLQTGTLVEVGA